MIHQVNYTLAIDLVGLQLEAFPKLPHVLINKSIQVERAKNLLTMEYERMEE